jgi:hypothetical protein
LGHELITQGYTVLWVSTAHCIIRIVTLSGMLPHR